MNIQGLGLILILSGLAKLLETRKAIIQGWNAVADKLEAQSEIVLGCEVLRYASPARTDGPGTADRGIYAVRQG